MRGLVRAIEALTNVWNIKVDIAEVELALDYLVLNELSPPEISPCGNHQANPQAQCCSGHLVRLC